MSEAKTQATTHSVDAFLATIQSPQQGLDSQALCALMTKVTGLPPTLWGPSIIGFGSYTYPLANGKQGSSLRLGFSPRKADITVYLMPEVAQYAPLLEGLGNYKTAKVCLYLKRLEDVDTAKLEAVLRAAWQHMATQYPA